jgi:hypothetical protein
MARPVALRVALDLAFTPVLAGLAAKQPLPPGMITVLKIAGGSDETLQHAVDTTGEPADRIRSAVILFLQTVLFTAAADSYRVLGAERSSTQAELRDHMGWLMKWLHPDRERSEWESSLALRVSSAWDDLKSPERRKAYDALHSIAVTARPTGSPRRQRRTRIPWVGIPQHASAPQRRGYKRAAFFILLAGLAGVAAMFWDDPTLFWGAVFADGIAGVPE